MEQSGEPIGENEATPLNAVTGADRLRSAVIPTLDRTRRSRLGQFMTPGPVAEFLASLFEDLPQDIRLLDAGAGLGVLTAAFVNEACHRSTRPSSIDVTAFEVDPTLAEHLTGTLAACAAQCYEHGIKFSSRLVRDDFILNSTEPLLRGSTLYDCAIINPPYAKISTASKERVSLRNLGIETSNLYTAFVALALNRLRSGGQIVAITPRSFCNGRYFEPFRVLLLRDSAIRRIHVYESRRQAFAEDDVLQENIVYRLVKGEEQPDFVTISSSCGPGDPGMVAREVPFNEVVLSSDRHRYIRLPLSSEDSALAERVCRLPKTLAELGLVVSTGRVVDFRAKDELRREPEEGTVPLIYPAHFDGPYVVWPRPNTRKYNALVVNTRTRDQTVPQGIYVLTKRFTSKEEKRRLVASLYDPVRVKAGPVGFENHLNYFHESGCGVAPDLARGLTLFLNSTAVDQYFRQFSGHTQVNATDLRNLRYPTRKQLVELGDRFDSASTSQEATDAAVSTLIS